MAAGDVIISICEQGELQGSPDAVGFWGSRKGPMLNTEHLPGIGPDASQATIAAEMFRVRAGAKQAEREQDQTLVWAEGHLITMAQWEAFKRDRFHTWHGEGWVMGLDHWVTQH